MLEATHRLLDSASAITVDVCQKLWIMYAAYEYITVLKECANLCVAGKKKKKKNFREENGRISVKPAGYGSTQPMNFFL